MWLGAINRSITPQVAGNDFFISTTGSDSNPGTQLAPWAITALNTKQGTYAGKKVGLLDGTYDVSTFPATLVTVKLAVTSGSLGSPTVIQAVNPRAAIISCDTTNPGYISAPIIGNGANGVGSTGTPQYITLKNLSRSPDLHSITADPLFAYEAASFVAGGGTAQYLLQNSSPCRGSGLLGQDMGPWFNAIQIGANFPR